MEMNENVIKGKWQEMKGELQKTWGKLTDNDLDKTKGDLKAIGGLIQQRYGKQEAAVEDKLSKIYQRYDTKKDAVLSKINNSEKGK